MTPAELLEAAHDAAARERELSARQREAKAWRDTLIVVGMLRRDVVNLRLADATQLDVSGLYKIRGPKPPNTKNREPTTKNVHITTRVRNSCGAWDAISTETVGVADVAAELDNVEVSAADIGRRGRGRDSGHRRGP